jgi:hypothetical protein
LLQELHGVPHEYRSSNIFWRCAFSSKLGNTLSVGSLKVSKGKEEFDEEQEDDDDDNDDDNAECNNNFGGEFLADLNVRGVNTVTSWNFFFLGEFVFPRSLALLFCFTLPSLMFEIKRRSVNGARRFVGTV